MLTGVWPHTHNVLTNVQLHPVRTDLAPERDVLVSGLKAQGYRLGYAGKWHLSPRFTPLDFGFDQYVSLADYDDFRNDLDLPSHPDAGNYLGPVAADYGSERLTRVVSSELYVLQYHLYTLALDRYLALRQPGYDYQRHVGGVLYVFLRGLAASDGALGVHEARPDAEMMAALREGLLP